MMKMLFTSAGVWPKATAVIRIITGLLLVIHGTQIFEVNDMKGYIQWLSDLHFPIPAVMAYAGKVTELLGGLCLALGIFTRLATGFLMITFTLIAFIMGHGKILSDAQHPFLFLLLASVFFFSGGGKWSLDHLLFNRESK